MTGEFAVSINLHDCPLLAGGNVKWTHPRLAPMPRLCPEYVRLPRHDVPQRKMSLRHGTTGAMRHIIVNQTLHATNLEFRR